MLAFVEFTLAVTVPFEMPEVEMLYSGAAVCTVQLVGMPFAPVGQFAPLAFMNVPVEAVLVSHDDVHSLAEMSSARHFI